MYQRIGQAAFKNDLTNIKRLLRHLDEPQNRFHTIHIAGTNGKGSTAHMLAAIFTAAGYKTGLYTSPHYRDFRERIKIDGQYIKKKTVVDFVRTHQAAFEAIQPSFFEWTVALGFHYFAIEKVDIAIIETGLGGRRDSTNVISPLLSVITNIGYDHMQVLGDTLPLIAGEKAGIIKAGIPAVIGETHPETAPVFKEKAADAEAPLQFADQIVRVLPLKKTPTHTIYETSTASGFYTGQIELNHLADYQQFNLCTVLAAMEIFARYYPDWNTNWPKAIRHGLFNLKNLTRFMGRWEFIQTDPRVLVDSAHNKEGITLAMKELKKLPFAHLHMVLGMVHDKPPGDLLKLLPKDATCYFVKANIPRGMEASVLQQHAARAGLTGKAYSSVRRALAAAKKKAGPEDLIYVGGSIFVVAEVV